MFGGHDELPGHVDPRDPAHLLDDRVEERGQLGGGERRPAGAEPYGPTRRPDHRGETGHGVHDLLGVDGALDDAGPLCCRPSRREAVEPVGGALQSRRDPYGPFITRVQAALEQRAQRAVADDAEVRLGPPASIVDNGLQRGRGEGDTQTPQRGRERRIDHDVHRPGGGEREQVRHVHDGQAPARPREPLAGSTQGRSVLAGHQPSLAR
jgi:hypothetical protein